MDKKEIKIIYIPNKEQLADPLTKPVDVNKHTWFIKSINFTL